MMYRVLAVARFRFYSGGRHPRGEIPLIRESLRHARAVGAVGAVALVHVEGDSHVAGSRPQPFFAGWDVAGFVARSRPTSTRGPHRFRSRMNGLPEGGRASRFLD
jgi:hypothetical protein